MKGTILQKASDAVHGERQETYGDAADLFDRSTGAFNSMTGLSLTPEQGMLFVMCMKMTRAQYAYHEDNWVDVAGYSELQGQLHHRRQQRSEEDSGDV